VVELKLSWSIVFTDIIIDRVPILEILERKGIVFVC
jgi:hypothetical protein